MRLDGQGMTYAAYSRLRAGFGECWSGRNRSPGMTGGECLIGYAFFLTILACQKRITAFFALRRNDRFFEGVFLWINERICVAVTANGTSVDNVTHLSARWFDQFIMIIMRQLQFVIVQI